MTVLHGEAVANVPVFNFPFDAPVLDCFVVFTTCLLFVRDESCVCKICLHRVTKFSKDRWFE